MNRKQIISLITFIVVGCESKTAIEEASDKADEPVKPTTYFTDIDSLDSHRRGNFAVYDTHMYEDSFQAGDLFTNVDFVRLYTHNTEDKEPKEYKDLHAIQKLSNLEAFFVWDTLYLKLFKLNSAAESGVRIKIANGKFSTAYYINMHGHHTLPGQPYTGKRYTEVEDYILSYNATQHQKLFLDKESYALGDTITGYMFYEAMIGNDAGSIYSKGKFKGVIKYGIQQTLTTPITH